MPGENIYDWSVTASNNANSDTLINWTEGQARASVNNSARSMMAAHAKQRDLQSGVIITGGSADAQTFTSGVNYTAVPTGLRVLLKIGPSLTNTGAATLSMDGIAAVAIKNQQGNDLSAGALTAGHYAEFLYNGTNWILISTSTINVVMQTFAASGTYTPTAGMQYCIIECVGGGGGGAAVLGVYGFMYMGAGGGSGGYSRKRATAADIGTSQVVTVGAGGGGGQYNVAGGIGSAGGDTSVGSLCIAKGAPAQSSWYASGRGAIATGTGDVVAGGSPGHGGAVMDATHGVAVGEGGSSIMGGGAPNQGWPSDGNVISGLAASSYGSGGSGASSNNTGAGPSGGSGSAGVVIITEFCA